MKILWTDGSAEPNPGPGGWAVILADANGRNGTPVAIGRDDNTTNIRMEGSAIIAAMKYAGAEGCEIHTDSEFWVNVLTRWAPGWEARGWRKSSGEIKNLSMVKEMYSLYRRFPVKLVWVKAHVGIELNEMADRWAGRAREGAEL